MRNDNSGSLMRIDHRPVAHQTSAYTTGLFYLTTHPTHVIYGYMESDIW